MVGGGAVLGKGSWLLEGKDNYPSGYRFFFFGSRHLLIFPPDLLDLHVHVLSHRCRHSFRLLLFFLYVSRSNCNYSFCKNNLLTRP